VLALMLAIAIAPAAAAEEIEAAAEQMEAELLSAELGRRYDDALFRRAVGSESPLVRAAAARAAGRLKDAKARAWLLPLLRDDAGRVRRAALFALGHIGGSEAVIPLREALPRLARSDVPHALEALGKTKDPRAVATVAAYLKSPEPAIRGQAALALFRLDDSSAVAELIGALLTEKNPEPRWREVYAISRLLRSKAREAKGPTKGDPAWVAPLMISASHNSPTFQERCFAVRALGAMKGNGERLVSFTSDSDSRIVVAATRALAGDPAGTHADTVASLVTHTDDLVREAAVAALVRWGDKAIPALEAAEQRLDGRLQLQLHIALAKAGRKAGSFRADGDEELAEEYVWRLAPHRKGKPLPPHGKLTGIEAMRAAAEACGEESIAIDAALPVLRHLLQIPDYTVQTMAIATLGERGAKGETERIVATAVAATGPTWIDVRVEAATALGKMKVYHPWLDVAARDSSLALSDAARTALEALERPLPPRRPRAGYRLQDQDARGILAAARKLHGRRVRITTNRGTMTMVLLPDEAPAHCVNFANLVGSGFYDGKRWHRIVANFVIQGGCPRGDGWGGPGYFLPDEIGTRPYVRGTVGMPRSGNDTGGCQIFITHLPTPHLDGNYSVYAQVIEGLDVIDRVRVGDTIESARLLPRK